MTRCTSFGHPWKAEDLEEEAKVMYDAFGVMLHAGKQVEVWQAFYVAATDRQNNEVVTQIRKR